MRLTPSGSELYVGASGFRGEFTPECFARLAPPPHDPARWEALSHRAQRTPTARAHVRPRQIAITSCTPSETASLCRCARRRTSSVPCCACVMGTAGRARRQRRSSSAIWYAPSDTAGCRSWNRQSTQYTLIVIVLLGGIIYHRRYITFCEYIVIVIVFRA